MTHPTFQSARITRARWHQTLISVGILAFLSACSAQQKSVPPPENNTATAVPAPKLRSAMPQMPCKKPVWPREAERHQLTGTVTMKFLIDPEGKVLEKEILKSSGHPSLDVAALDGTARCKLQVAPQGGEPKNEWVVLQYVWTFD